MTAVLHTILEKHHPERERQRERQRQTDRQRQIDRQRETERKRQPVIQTERRRDIQR